MAKTIITIGREFGSGGHEIGKLLAAKLNLPFYDKEIIALAANEGSMDAKLLEGLDEKGSNRFFYALPTSKYLLSGMLGAGIDLSMNDRLFLLQSKVIKKIADESSCVIVGRCSDYVLKGYSCALHVFIYADKKDRIKRVTERQHLSEEEAERLIDKTDKARASYYSYYSGNKWGAYENHHLAIDSAMGAEKTTAVLLKLVEEYYK